MNRPLHWLEQQQYNLVALGASPPFCTLIARFINGTNPNLAEISTWTSHSIDLAKWLPSLVVNPILNGLGFDPWIVANPIASMDGGSMFATAFYCYLYFQIVPGGNSFLLTGLDKIRSEMAAIRMELAPYKHKKEAKQILKKTNTGLFSFSLILAISYLLPGGIALAAFVSGTISLFYLEFGLVLLFGGIFWVFCYVITPFLCRVLRPGQRIELIHKNIDRTTARLRDIEAREAYLKHLEQQEQRQIRGSKFYDDM